MTSLDRRTFLKVVGAIPFAVWMERDALAQTGTLVRYNVLSTEGQAMLKIYADGVSKMKALPASDPRSWTFQWYIHAVPDDRTKTTELNRIYPVSGPERDAGKQCLETCQAHFNRANEPFFLPWHRMYLLRFERIIRKLTNQPQVHVALLELFGSRINAWDSSRSVSNDDEFAIRAKSNRIG